VVDPLCAQPGPAAAGQRGRRCIADAWPGRNPTGDLPFADAEATAATNAWLGGRLAPLRGPAAQPSAVLRLLNASDVLHFAGHGAFVPDDPLESHLLCAPGTSGELVTLRMLLETGSALRTRVIMLSACETGRVAAEDALNDQLGLPGGLLAAGASAVLATFWPVGDLAAALVLSQTIAIWGREPVTLETALGRAQTWLRTQATAGVVRRWLDEQHTEDAATREGLDDARESLAGLSEDSLLFTDEYSWAAFHVSGRGVRLR
jgi:CHAT domain-containing protein